MSDLETDLKYLEHKELNEHNGGVEYMADMDNWVCVHLTKYEPKRNSAGDLYLETTSMATDYEELRSTNHVTINQRVGNVFGGNFDDASIAVLASYNGIVEKNGNPQEVATEDTYFVPNPDTGLVLPKDTYIVRPDPNCKDLFVINEHSATYKSDNYTNQEIEQILSLDEHKKQQYEEYMSGQVPEWDVDMLLGYDKKLRKIYDNTKDKQAFWRGLFEEDRYAILNNILRDAVIKKALDKMGYHYVFSHEDAVSHKVAEVALQSGINGNSGNKGHSLSLEGDVEIEGANFNVLEKALKNKNIEDICMWCEYPNSPLRDQIVLNILSEKPIPNIYRSFEKTAALHTVESIKEYNPYLDTVLHRFADKITDKCNQSLSRLKEDPHAFASLKKRLQLCVDEQKIDIKANWLENTRQNYADTLEIRDRIRTFKQKLNKTPEDISMNSDDELSNKTKHAMREDAYKDINPELAALRDKERRAIKDGMDPKQAKRERREAVRAYYNKKSQREG